MAKVAADVQNVVEVCCDSKMMMEVLPVLAEQLELPEGSTAFPDTKRAMFPRFYFALTRHCWRFCAGLCPLGLPALPVWSLRLGHRD